MFCLLTLNKMKQVRVREEVMDLRWGDPGLWRWRWRWSFSLWLHGLLHWLLSQLEPGQVRCTDKQWQVSLHITLSLVATFSLISKLHEKEPANVQNKQWEASIISIIRQIALCCPNQIKSSLKIKIKHKKHNCCVFWSLHLVYFTVQMDLFPMGNQSCFFPYGKSE